MGKVKNIKLASTGGKKVEMAEREMPVLIKIRNIFKKEKPFKNVRIAACLHITKETAVLMRTLKVGGAEIAIAGSNPLSTQDDIAAFLLEEGFDIYAWRGNHKHYYWCIDRVLDIEPNITMDDGADLVVRIHTKKTELIKKIYGGTEETTTGVNRFIAMEKCGKLKYPIIAVNNAYTKYLFDNRYGTGQSVIDGIMRATSTLIAGKIFVVAGYGWCGRGIAMRARGMGARVIVTEINPLRALEAIMDGFEVKKMEDAAKIGDIFVTATGNKNVIRYRHMLKMKNNAILANAGHFNVEIDVYTLEKIANKKKISNLIDEYTLRNGRKILLLGEGRLVNLVAAEGHPSCVMDMSFANQALSVKYIVENYTKLKPKVYDVPREIDKEIARLKLKSMNINIDNITDEQKKYIEEWGEGTTLE